MAFWIVTLVLSVTWDTTVSERLTAPIFMVDGGSIFLLNDGIFLPDYGVKYAEGTLQLSLKCFQNV